MNNAASNIDSQPQSWPFLCPHAVNYCQSAGNPLSFSGVNSTNFQFHPQYMQFLNVLRFPLIFSPRHGCEHNLASNTYQPLSENLPTEKLAHTSPSERSPSRRNFFDFMLAANFSNNTESNSFQNLGNGQEVNMSGLQTQIFPWVEKKKAEDDPDVAPKSQKIASPANRSECEESQEEKQRQKRPYLKFGVQAILSQVSPTVTGLIL